jgi:hypothetical protein
MQKRGANQKGNIPRFIFGSFNPFESELLSSTVSIMVHHPQLICKKACGV